MKQVFLCYATTYILLIQEGVSKLWTASVAAAEKSQWKRSGGFLPLQPIKQRHLVEGISGITARLKLIRSCGASFFSPAVCCVAVVGCAMCVALRRVHRQVVVQHPATAATHVTVPVPSRGRQGDCRRRKRRKKIIPDMSGEKRSAPALSCISWGQHKLCEKHHLNANVKGRSVKKMNFEENDSVRTDRRHIL